MSEEDDIAKLAISHGGWLAPIVTGLGLWLLKKLLASQYIELLREFREMQDAVAVLTNDVGIVKAIIRERSRTGTYTWPGDGR